MAGEHRCHAPKLCANNCGFFGSLATQNLCSKCYRDLQLKELQSSNSNAMLVLNQSLTTTHFSSSFPAQAEALLASSFVPEPSVSTAPAEEAKEEVRTGTGTANRCWNCRRRVGLTGFKCRCGITFCGTHRYPEQHSCGFDFKALGQEEIKKVNPVVKVEKLDKI